MDFSESIDKASDVAFAKLGEVNGAIEALSEPYKTIVLIYSAQGVLDNGGLVYFFESDFPKNPPYQLFIEAYNKIGATEIALALTSALTFFKIENPEKNIEARLEFLRSLPNYHYGYYPHEFLKLNEAIIGNVEVWKQLNRYVANY